ncbi:twitching motility protein PilT [Sphingomonas koreensis]|nr:twitching motility protein PilT [Sphingomonas koreensis]
MSVVLDASAVLALIFEEPGGEIVLAESKGSLLSTVNFDEVLLKSAEWRISAEDVLAQLGRLEVSLVPFDLAQAKVSATLQPILHKKGISFAGRACMALATTTGSVILTGDKGWALLDLGLDIRLIR